MKPGSRPLALLLACCFFHPVGLSASGQAEKNEGTLSPRRVLDNLAAKQYSGRRIDLVSLNTGLQEVIAKLEEAGGIRLQLDPSINDKVTYRMRDIPWDEALATVLADNALHIALNLEGAGFKIGRGKLIVLALNDPARAGVVVFLYTHLFSIAAGVVLLAAVLVGLRVLRNRRARKRTAVKKPLLPAEAAEQAKKELDRLLRDERLYRDEGLTLQALAEKLTISPHQLSWILNEVLQVSFPSLINGYRVEEVKNRLADPASDKTSILQAAMDAGFNTKASFNRAFKKITGMTPSQFKKSRPR